MGILDEALFAFDEVMDFVPTWHPGPPASLGVKVDCADGAAALPALKEALARIPVVATAIAEQGLCLSVASAGQNRKPGAKRRIVIETSS